METLKNLGYTAFLNKYGWMNSMKGSQWKELVIKYQKQFEKTLEPVKPLANDIYNELLSNVSYVEPIELYDVKIQMTGTLHYVWKYNDEKKYFKVCADIDVLEGKRVWTVEDRSNGAEKYKVSYHHFKKHIWTHPHPIAPFVAVMDGRCYFLEAEKDLWYCRLVSLDANTGKGRKVLYIEKDPRWNLALIKGENECLFLQANNAGQQRLFHITHNEVKELGKGVYESFVTIGSSRKGGEPCYFARRVGEEEFEYVCKALNNKNIPSLKTNIPEWYSFSDNILCTRHLGIRTLWKVSTGEKIEEIVGDYELNTILPWRLGKSYITVARPGFDRVMYGNTTLCSYAASKYKQVKSADGTEVPFILVQGCDKASALLCVAYGAYGLPTHLDTSRWKPLLRRGWAICICLVRGGGDYNDNWAEAARRENKIKSVEDFEACIRLAKKDTGVVARHTAIYGRSAGGYLVGATLARNTKSRLFGAVYTEVPYVDVLSTTANPKLPLTELEYNEFGDPLRRIINTEALLNLSPIHALPEEGAPDIFVLCRTGLQDKEVFAYEPVKWITALQEAESGIKGAQPKVLAITADQGHFVGGDQAFLERAEDLAILENWNKKSNIQIYKMANTRRNRKANTRKNNARKNNMMGGKKSSKNTRKSHKKSQRKGSKSRKH